MRTVNLSLPDKIWEGKKSVYFEFNLLFSLSFGYGNLPSCLLPPKKPLNEECFLFKPKQHLHHRPHTLSSFLASSFCPSCLPPPYLRSRGISLPRSHLPSLHCHCSPRKAGHSGRVNGAAATAATTFQSCRHLGHQHSQHAPHTHLTDLVVRVSSCKARGWECNSPLRLFDKGWTQ